MSSLDHKFDTDYEDFDLDAFDSQASGVRHAERSRWLRGFSVRGKLNLAVFGNTVVLAALALIILGGTWMLGQSGQAQAKAHQAMMHGVAQAKSLASGGRRKTGVARNQPPRP